MEKKINVAELLKDCPRGMDLDCTMLDNVVFEKIDTGSPFHPIIIRRTDTNKTIHLTKYGQYSIDEDYKCVIFPKGKTTWEGFQRPFKDGDILSYTTSRTTVFIYRNKNNEPKYTTSFYVGHTIGECYCNFHIYNKTTLIALNGDCDVRIATEEEKQKLFDAIKENGYEWNEETKTLEKSFEPKFKVGDYVVKKNGVSTPVLITTVGNDFYYSNIEKSIGFFSIQEQDDWVLFKPKFKVGDKIKDKNSKVWFVVHVSEKHFSISSVPNAEGYFVPIEDQDDYELVPNKFDITTLKPFESKVLVRDTYHYEWEGAVFGRYDGNSFFTIGGTDWKYCIPYEGNEHLLGTACDCNDYYKIWE